MSKKNDIARDLMARILRNDNQAFSELYDRYNRLVYSVILNIIRVAPEAEDVLQEVFLSLWNKKQQYDFSKASPLTWLTVMARNRSIDKTRSAQYKGALKTSNIDDNPAAYHLQFEGPNPLEGVILEEKQSQVRSALNLLPQDQQVILRVAYFEGLTQAEIAERYSIPLGTVKTRMRLALKKLAEVLKEAA